MRDLHENFEERAAIIEYLGGFPREESEEIASRITGYKLGDLPAFEIRTQEESAQTEVKAKSAEPKVWEVKRKPGSDVGRSHLGLALQMLSAKK